MSHRGSPARHLRGLSALIIEKLNSHRRCLFMNTPAMVAGIRSHLAAAGLDVPAAVQKGSLVLSSDQSHLLNGRFDVGRMLQMLKDALRQAFTDGYQGLFATGDMAWELGDETDFSLLLEYERGLDELFRTLPALEGVCQYRKDSVPQEALVDMLYTHRAVFVNEKFSRVNPYYLLPQCQPPSPPKVSVGQVTETLARLNGEA